MAKVELADVNVLIALFDPEHVHHNAAQDWFADACQQAWATCPITENGFLRIVTRSNYPTVLWSVSEAVARLAATIANNSACHTFFSDTVSLSDTTLFRREGMQGPNQLTDIYLLGLCNHNSATLVTFDSGIRESVHALVNPRNGLVRLLAV